MVECRPMDVRTSYRMRVPKRVTDIDRLRCGGLLEFVLCCFSPVVSISLVN